MKEIGNNLLAIDTSIGEGSISIWYDGIEIARQIGDPEKPPLSETILEMIENLSREQGLLLENFDCIAIALGPGSYTGIRVGISTALGISLAVGCKTIGIPTLTALSIECQNEKCMSVLSIGGEDLAIQASEPGQNSTREYSEMTIVNFDGFRKLLLCKIFTDKKTAGVLNGIISGSDLPSEMVVASDNISHLVAMAALSERQEKADLSPIYARNFGSGR